jgi:prophage DNA circulation protein
MGDESLELAEVQAAFREAESRFTELASAASGLKSVSDQLSDARASVLEAAGRLTELAEANSAVSQQLAEATRAIEATDPAEIQTRLRDLAAAMETQVRTSSEALSALRAGLRRSARLQMILATVTLVAVIVVGALLFVL